MKKTKLEVSRDYNSASGTALSPGDDHEMCSRHWNIYHSSFFLVSFNIISYHIIREVKVSDDEKIFLLECDIYKGSVSKL